MSNGRVAGRWRHLARPRRASSVAAGLACAWKFRKRGPGSNARPARRGKWPPRTRRAAPRRVPCRADLTTRAGSQSENGRTARLGAGAAGRHGGRRRVRTTADHPGIRGPEGRGPVRPSWYVELPLSWRRGRARALQFSPAVLFKCKCVERGHATSGTEELHAGQVCSETPRLPGAVPSCRESFGR